MSGIFNLFNGNENSTSQPFDVMKKLSTSSTSLGKVAETSGKNVGFSRPKSKGLSIRSKSDLNVASFGPKGEKSPVKKSSIEGKFLKTQIGSTSCVFKQLSPRSREKNSKLQALKSKQLKAISSKSRSPGKVLPSEKLRAEMNSFKKPFSPKINKKPIEIYSEPEKLANYYSEENDFYSITENLDREFVRLVSLSKPPVKSYEDEGFESDPELIEQPSCNFFQNVFENEITAKSPSLPSISDDDDDFFN